MDFGLDSRNLKDDERTAIDMKASVLCLDGVAVVVNRPHGDELTKAQG